MILSRVCVLVLLLNGFSLCGQSANTPYAPLASYDFSQGQYKLIFIPHNSSDGDTISFVAEVEVLNRLKEAWVFTEEAVTYPFACNDGFSVLLTQSEKVEARYQMRLRCEAFVGNGKYWHLPAFTPQIIGDKVERGQRRDTAFVDIYSGREALRALRRREDVVFVLPPEWEQYEGYFYFSYPNPNHSGRTMSTSWKDLANTVSRVLHAQYPDQSFELKLARYGFGPNYETVSFRVRASREFFHLFKTHPINEWGWRPFEAKLTVYYQR